MIKATKEMIQQDCQAIAEIVYERYVLGDCKVSYMSLGEVGDDLGIIMFKGHAGHAHYIMKLMQKMIDNPSDYFAEKSQLDKETEDLIKAASEALKRMKEKESGIHDPSER